LHLIIENLRCFWLRWFSDVDTKMLCRAKGVLHVGAHTGQERDRYRSAGLKVIWFEAIPEIFNQLHCNIRGYKNQVALNYLLTDSDGEVYDFNISSNNGMSSSILALGDHKDIWPDVRYNSKIKVVGRSFSEVAKVESLVLDCYDCLVMDTQGSELLVLKGMGDHLKRFRFIKTEAADFEAYIGCCTANELKIFLNNHGFHEYFRELQVTHPSKGAYYELYFQRMT
jgi:FkbM family methyltransferase